MNQRLLNALQRKIQRHNKLLVLITVWSGFLVICMWVAIYFVANWAVIFFKTLIEGVDAEPPGHFGWGFLTAIALWLAAGWLEQKRQPAYLRSNDKTFLEVFLELALIPPRATLSTLRRTRERVVLEEGELLLATDLLERIGRAGKLPEEAVADVFDPEVNHESITEALVKLDLIRLREIKGQDVYAITDPQRLAAFL